MRIPKGYPYQPDEIHKIGAWIIKIFKDEDIVLCHKGKNINVVITKDTYRITKLPKNVIDFLWKIGFMQKWKERQIEKTVLRLRDIRIRWENSPNRKMGG